MLSVCVEIISLKNKSFLPPEHLCTSINCRCQIQINYLSSVQLIRTKVVSNSIEVEYDINNILSNEDQILHYKIKLLNRKTNLWGQFDNN